MTKKKRQAIGYARANAKLAENGAKERLAHYLIRAVPGADPAEIGTIVTLILASAGLTAMADQLELEGD